MPFGLDDFDSLISKGSRREAQAKFSSLVAEATKRSGYSAEVRFGRDAYSASLTKPASRASFFLLMNSEDLSVELRIAEKKAILSFLGKVSVNDFRSLQRLGDSEIALWNQDWKVCKVYPRYVDERVRSFVLGCAKSVDKPMLRIRKIYSRDRQILRSRTLSQDIAKSIRTLERLNSFV